MTPRRSHLMMRICAATLICFSLSSTAVASDPKSEAIAAAAAAAEAAALAAQAAAAAARAAAGLEAPPTPGKRTVTKEVRMGVAERLKLLGSGVAYLGAGLATGTSGVITGFLGLMVITNSNAFPVHSVSTTTFALFFGFLALSSQLTNQDALKRFAEGGSRIARAWRGRKTIEMEEAAELEQTLLSTTNGPGQCQLELFPSEHEAPHPDIEEQAH